MAEKEAPTNVYDDDDDDKPLDLTEGNPEQAPSGKYPPELLYITAFFGVLEMITFGLSLIAYLCFHYSDICDRMTTGTISFYASMSLSSCVTMALWFLMRVVMVCQKKPVDSWRLWEMIILGAYGILFLVADIIIATQTCGHASLEASVVFGFLSVISLGIHFFCSYYVWKETESSSAMQEQQTAEQDSTSTTSSV